MESTTKILLGTVISALAFLSSLVMFLPSFAQTNNATSMGGNMTGNMTSGNMTGNMTSGNMTAEDNMTGNISSRGGH